MFDSEVWKPYKDKELYCAKVGWSRYKNKSASKVIQWVIDYPNVSVMYRLVNLLEQLIHFIKPKPKHLGKQIFISGGNYTITSTIEIKSHTKLVGEK